MKHYIELMDGSKMEGMPKSIKRVSRLGGQISSLMDCGYSQLRGGTTLQRCKSAVAQPHYITKREMEEAELFLKNIHPIVASYDRIKRDSRIFLAPVPALATSYFGSHATMGIYLEWWRNYKCSQLVDDKGNAYLIYAWGGNLLCGNNTCRCIDATGKCYDFEVECYRNIWESFEEVASRYRDAVIYYDSYTIKESIEKLFGYCD